MNEELLAALFVRSGALLVSHNGFINFLQFSNVKPTQVCSAPAGHQVISTTSFHLKENYDLNSAFENADKLLEQKRTDSQFHYITPLTFKSQLVMAFFNSIKNQRSPSKKI